MSLTTTAQAEEIKTRRDLGTYKYAQAGTWQIFGTTRTRFCTAITRFDHMHMAISFTRHEVSLMVLGINQTLPTGKTSKHLMALSTGDSWVAEAHVPTANVLVFRDLDRVTTNMLAQADELTIEHIGRFSLAGAKEAMSLAMRCYVHLNTH